MESQLLDIDACLEEMAEELALRLSSVKRENVLMAGIHSGGHWIAQRLHSKLALPTPLASLSISFYRDDFSRIGLHPRVTPSDLPLGVDSRHVILVDDVLHTGRTVRAAMNEIFDYGRPASIVLAVLLDRGGQELPICPNVVGQRLELPPDTHIKLCESESLHWVEQTK
ncbi:MAG: bifunctional pyr operon transcriptional regulator/uracil phosphoribosyltransferase PyrR [Candidatus Eutrophobiaceae bacterium]